VWLVAAGSASAQMSAGPPISASAAEAGSSGVDLDLYPGDGVRLSESALMHVGVGAEVGYDTNVYYTDTSDSANPAKASAVMNITPFLTLSNAPRPGQPFTPTLSYTLGASLLYREYLTNEDLGKAQRGFSPSAYLSLGSAVGPSVGFNLSDSFSRIEEAPFTAQSESIKRDHNLGAIQLRLAPGGGRIQTTLSYSNQLDIYETAIYASSNNMTHLLTLDVAWKWLPKTAVFIQGKGGYIVYLNPTEAHRDSFPIEGTLGIRGLITTKLSATIFAGYGTAHYADSGWVKGTGNISVGAALAYRPTTFTNVALSYQHGFRNSPILGDYYNLDGVGLLVNQAIGRRLVAGLEGRYEWRRYAFVTPNMMSSTFGREDHVVVGLAKVDYFIQKWFYAGIGYTITSNSSNLAKTSANALGANYLKQQILGRVGFTY
jgi:hypothetical protein